MRYCMRCLQVEDVSEGQNAALLRAHNRVAPCVFVDIGGDTLQPLAWQAPRQSADALARRWQADIEQLLRP